MQHGLLCGLHSWEQSNFPGQLLQCVKLIWVELCMQDDAAADLLRWHACNRLTQLIMLQPNGSLKGYNGFAG